MQIKTLHSYIHNKTSESEKKMGKKKDKRLSHNNSIFNNKDTITHIHNKTSGKVKKKIKIRSHNNGIF